MSVCNVATLARLCLAGLAGFALVILPASLAEAVYGPRTTIGTNYQQTSSTTSVDGITEAGCISFCYVLFQKTPAQKPLIVQHVSCRVTVSTGSLRYGYLGTRRGQTLPQKRTYLVAVPTTGITSVVNSPVMHLVESGDRVLVLLSNDAAGDWFAECTISGTLQ